MTGSPRAALASAVFAIAVAAVVLLVPAQLVPKIGGLAPPEPGPSSPASRSGPSSSSGSSSPSGGLTAPPPVGVHAADDANLRKGARVIDCPSCDGGRRVGYIGGPNTLAIRADVPQARRWTLLIVYETREPRTLMVAANDDPPQTVTLPGAGDYLIPARTSMTVALARGTNWIRFFNDTGSAPDINRIELR